MSSRGLSLLSALLLIGACGARAAEPRAEPGVTASSGAEAELRTAADLGAAPSPQSPASASAQSARAAGTAVSDEPVWLNGEQLSAPDLRELEAVLGAAPAPGRYWYDARSGLWGLEEHGAGGATRPGLRTPAKLAADASHGHSGAFVNDRELTAHELAVVAQLLGWPAPAGGELRGRYVLDEQGRLYSIQGRYLGSVASAAPQALATSTSPAPCAWLQLGGKPDVLGRDVTVNCD